jgi:hypothetical protein
MSSQQQQHQQKDGIAPKREPEWSIAIKNFSPQW